MKKTYFLAIFFVALIVASCDKTVTFDDQWKLDQEAQFAKIAANTSEYKKIESQSGNGFIMYKEVETGNGESPHYTDQVKILYTGYFKRFWDREDQFIGDDGNTFFNKNIVVTTETNSSSVIPRTLTVSDRSVIDGLATALQHMQVGDKWEIWIPWKLGYGASTNSQIPAHTTLVFEVQLVEVL